MSKIENSRVAWLFWLLIAIVGVRFYTSNKSISTVETLSPQTSVGNTYTEDPRALPEIISETISEIVLEIASETVSEIASEIIGINASIIVPFSKIITTAPVNDLLIDPYGIVWAATEDGITSVQNNQITHYSMDTGKFPFPQAQCVMHDGERLWVGSLFGLAVESGNRSFTKVDLPPIVSSEMIWSLAWDGSNIWIGTSNGLVFRNKKSNYILINSENTNSGLSGNWCQKIIKLKDWIVVAHNKGISLWNTNFPAANPEWWKNIEYSEAGIVRPVTGMVSDDKHLWISTPKDMMHTVTPIDRFFSDLTSNLVNYSKLHRLSISRINDIVYHRGALWLATNTSLARIKNEKIQLILSKNDESVNKKRKLATNDDLLWIGSDSGIQFINTAMVD